MKTNPDKYNFLASLDMNSNISVSSFVFENAHSKKRLVITIDRKSNFHDREPNLCKKESTKISVMKRVLLFMLLNQKELIMKAILMSQFGYCPLV